MITLQAMKVYDFEDYRHFLKYTLTKRIEENNSYSLRSMSKSLDISPATFSQILSGKRQLSPQKAKNVANRLNLPLEEVQYFELLVSLLKAKDENAKSEIQNSIDEIKPKVETVKLQESQFQIFSTWYYGVILELLSVKDFKPTVSNIAKCLNLNKFVVIEAMDNLLIAKMATVKDGVYKRSKNRVVMEAELLNKAIVSFYMQMMDKAKNHLENKPKWERATGAETISIKKDKKAELEKLVNQFLDKVSKLGDESDEADSVYQINVQAFLMAHVPKESKT